MIQILTKLSIESISILFSVQAFYSVVYIFSKLEYVIYNFKILRCAATGCYLNKLLSILVKLKWL